MEPILICFPGVQGIPRAQPTTVDYKKLILFRLMNSRQYDRQCDRRPLATDTPVRMRFQLE